MNRYTKYQIVASICVALFIISTALIILAHNKNIYNKCYEEYYIEAEGKIKYDLKLRSTAEVSLYNEQLSDSFTAFFNKDYNISGYEISEANIQKLNSLKAIYKGAVILAVLSFTAGCYSIWFISRRREYMPLVYGGVLAALLTSVNVLILIVSENKLVRAVRNMVFEKEYNYFVEGDVLTGMFPPEYARWLLLAYIIFVLGLIIVMVLLRQLIVFLGRPHKF